MTSDPNAFWAALRAPFPPEDLDWRVGATQAKGDEGRGLCLVYVTARAVMDRLDLVAGPENWLDTYRREGNGTGWVCRLEVTTPAGVPVIHEDGADETQVEATKGGISDALKRAAVKFGIGRYLYHVEPEWGPIERRGKTWVFKRGWKPAIAQGVQVRPAPQPPAPAAKPEAPPPPAVDAPGDKPPWWDVRVSFGEYRGKTWGEVASGSIKGRRYGYLEWIEVSFGDGEEDPERQKRAETIRGNARKVRTWMLEQAVARGEMTKVEMSDALE